MSESRRSPEREEEYPPRAGNTELTIVSGPPTNPRTFTFSSPHHHFTRGLNGVMLVLPELLERIAPEEAGVYAPGQNVRQTAVNTVATESDYLILCDCSAGGIAVSLFSATKAGRTLVIVKVDSSGNAVTVTPFGNDTIESAASKTLTAQYDKVILTANGVSTWIDEGTGEI